MNLFAYILCICLIMAELLPSSQAGLLLNLLLGGNNGAPQNGPNLPFLNYNNNQNAPNDYPDYNLGTSRDMNYGRVNDYDTPQQQNYLANEPSGDFNQQSESFNQNDYSGSQEHDYNRNPSNFNDEDLRMARPNIPSTSATNLNNHSENNVRQVTSVKYNGQNVNKINNSGSKKVMSRNDAVGTSENPIQFINNMAFQNKTINNNQVLSKLHSNDSNTNSINLLPTLAKVINSSNIETKSPTIVVVKLPVEVSRNSTITENTAGTKNVFRTKTNNLLKPITKRKFFFQVKPVMPEPKRVSDMETVFYIE